MKKFENLFLVFSLTLTFILSFSSTKALAAENYNSGSIVQTEEKTDDTNLSRKESVIEFMKQNPEYKDEVMKILNDKGALNADGSIKENLGISNTLTANRSVSPLYTGYDYIFEGCGPADFYPKEVVAKYTNKTSKPKNFSVTQNYSVSTSYYNESSIGAKAKLDEIYEINAGVTTSYTYTDSASTQYGTEVSVPAYTTGVLKASAIKQCYSFHEQYYLLGVAVGDSHVVGIFKPTGVHWYYSEESN